MNMNIYEIIFIFLSYYERGNILILINFLSKIYSRLIHFFEYYNKHVYPNLYENLYESEEQIDTETSIDNNSKIVEEKVIQRYEDKYLDDIRRISKEWEFTNEELSELPIISCKLFTSLKENTEEELEELKLKCEQQSKQEIINRRIDKLANCYVMEKTPIGNVLMIYDKNLNKFKYYSDSTMPYRYLEVVGRKYVKIFNCRPIYIDMEEELKLFEQKWEKEQELKKIKEEEEKLKNEELKLNNEQNMEIKKKNIFAKFKSYNKETSGQIGMIIPPKNNIIINSIPENKENEKLLLKEKANCYCFEGKISNFNFLNKIEKKIFNKKLGFTFADFKKMNLQNMN